MKQKYEHLWWPCLTDCQLWGCDWSRTPAAPLKSVLCVCIGTVRPTGCSPPRPGLHTVWRQVCAWSHRTPLASWEQPHSAAAQETLTQLFLPLYVTQSQTGISLQPSSASFLCSLTQASTIPQYILELLIPSISPLTWIKAASTTCKVSLCDAFDKPLPMGTEGSPTRFLAPGLWRAELWVHGVGWGMCFFWCSAWIPWILISIIHLSNPLSLQSRNGIHVS